MSQAWGSMLLVLAVVSMLVIAAARRPAVSEPANRQLVPGTFLVVGEDQATRPPAGLANTSRLFDICVDLAPDSPLARHASNRFQATAYSTSLLSIHACGRRSQQLRDRDRWNGRMLTQ